MWDLAFRSLAAVWAEPMLVLAFPWAAIALRLARRALVLVGFLTQQQ